MPRIVHVVSTPKGIGGAEQTMLALVADAADRGWQVTILNPFAASDNTEIERRCDVPVETYAVASWMSIPSMRSWLQRRLRELEPDIVHAHLFHALVTVASLRSRAWKTILSHHHGDRMRSQGRWLEERLDRWGGHRFDKVVACSDWVRQFLLEDYRYPPELVTTIQNGWSGSARPLLPDDVPTIVCVANFRPAKGHRVLLEAFARIAERTPETQLILVGDGPLRREIEAHADELGVRSRVDLVGATDDVWKYLSRAHVAVQPSLAETFGIATLEAMAAGLPVVASNVGGIPEVVEDGATGILVPPGDVEGLTRALNSLLIDRAGSESMGEAGRLRAETLTTKRMVDEYYELYERTVGSGSRA